MNSEKISVGLKMHMKAKIVHNNKLVGRQVMIGNERLEEAKEDIYLGQTSANSRILVQESNIMMKNYIATQRMAKSYSYGTGNTLPT